MLQIRRRLDSRVRDNKEKSTKAIERIDAVLNGLDNDGLSFLARLGTGPIGEVVLSPPELSQDRMKAAIHRARRFEIAGVLELAALKLADLRFKTVIPYFHRDELLDQLWSLGEQYGLIISELDSAPDPQTEETVGRKAVDLLAQLGTLTSRIQFEKKRRLLRSIFWPALGITSFALLIAQAALGSVNLALVGSVIFLVALAAFLMVTTGPNVVALVRTMSRKGRLRYIALLAVIPTFFVVAIWLSDLASGKPPTFERLGSLFLLSLALDALLVLAGAQDAKKNFIKSQQQELLGQLAELK